MKFRHALAKAKRIAHYSHKTIYVVSNGPHFDSFDTTETATTRAVASVNRYGITKIR